MAETNKPNKHNKHRQKVQAAFANLQSLLREELKNARDGTEYKWYLNSCKPCVNAAEAYYTTAQRAKDSE